MKNNKLNKQKSIITINFIDLQGKAAGSKKIKIEKAVKTKEELEKEYNNLKKKSDNEENLIKNLIMQLEIKQELLFFDSSMQKLSDFAIGRFPIERSRKTNWAKIRSATYIMYDCMVAWREFDINSKQKRVQLIAILQTFVLYQDAINEIIGKPIFKEDDKFRYLRNKFISHSIVNSCFINTCGSGKNWSKVKINQNNNDYEVEEYNLEKLLIEFLEEINKNETYNKFIKDFLSWCPCNSEFRDSVL